MNYGMKVGDNKKVLSNSLSYQYLLLIFGFPGIVALIIISLITKKIDYTSRAIVIFLLLNIIRVLITSMFPISIIYFSFTILNLYIIYLYLGNENIWLFQEMYSKGYEPYGDKNCTLLTEEKIEGLMEMNRPKYLFLPKLK